MKTYGVKGSFSKIIDVDVIKRYNEEIAKTPNGITAYYRAMSDGNGNVIQCNKATRDLIASQHGAMVSTEALDQAQIAASKSGSKFAGVMKTLKGALINFGIILAIEGIIALVKFTQKTFFPTVNQLKEELNETTQEIADLHSEQESLNSELGATEQRIAELKAQGTLTFTEEAELNRLQKENAELERKLELTKANKAASESEFEGAFLEAFNSDYGDKATFNYTGKRGFWDKVTDALLDGSETRLTAEEYINDLFASYEKSLSGDKAYEHNLDKYKERINDVYEDYQGYLKQLEDADYSYGTNEQIDGYIDQINEFNDRYLIAFGNTENLFAQIVSRDKFADGYSAIQELGNITQETLSKLYNQNEKVRELINYLMGLGTVDWKTILGNDKFAELDTNADGTLTTLELFDQTTSECKVTSEQLAQAMSGVANELNKVEDVAEGAASNVKKFSDVFKSIKEGTDVLSDAYSDIEDGGEISLEHLMALLDAYPDLVEYVNLENGQHTITKDVLKVKFEAIKQTQLAQIAANKAAVNAEISEQKAILDTIAVKKEKAKQDLAASMVKNGTFKTLTEALNHINARPGYYIRGFDWDVSNANVAIANAQNELKKLNAQEALINNISWKDITSGSGSNSTNGKTEAEKYFAKLKYNLETNKITQEQYLKSLDAGYKKYYSNRSKYLEEFEQYSQEVYNGFKDMYKDDLNAQKNAWEEKKTAVSDYYDNLRKQIEEAHDKEDYEKEQSEKRKEIFDLDMKIAELMRDGSEKAKARIAELEEERLKAEEDLRDFETDKAREDELKRLEKEQESEEKKIQDKIDGIQGQLDKLDEDTVSVRNAIIAYAKQKGVALSFAYASGTRSSVGGFGRINEKGIEMISAPDGNGNYVNLMPNSYVFSAKATEFLWKLATEHSLPQAMYNSIAKSIQTQSNTPSVNIAQPVNITMGDVIIQGNADKQTVADIKKQQESTVRMVLQKIKELQNQF